MSGQLNLDALRRKYREERDKRLEADGGRASIRVAGDLARQFDADPWAPKVKPREAVTWDMEVLIIGGGFAGMLAGGNLRKHGIAAKDLCIVERGADFGGTWYWNRYPGLSCDTESYCYLPLLEETGYVPKDKYSYGPELLSYSQLVGRHFGLYERALFQTFVTDAVWNEQQTRWMVKTDRGDVIRAKYLWLCGGATNLPKLPGIPGITEFRGHSFHTMRWDYGYTGGGPNEKLVKLADKRVGVIGTGCTAIQCVPPLAEGAAELFVFQRTPSAVNVRANRPTDPKWAAQLKPGWQLHRMENFLGILSGIPQDVDLVDDGWTWNFKEVRHFQGEDPDAKPIEDLEEVDFELMEQVRARVEAIVKDRKTADALKPWYGLLCKRPTFHDSYLETFNRPNVTLVDTEGRGVERITARGVIANDKEYELDCIIFATGFDVSAGIVASLGFEPKGVGGITLPERWARELSTLHGVLISDFPNMFFIGGFQGTLATTRTFDMSVQTDHCARIVEYCRKKGIDRFVVKHEAETAWLAEMAAQSVDHRKYFQACTPGLFNGEGKLESSIWDYFYGGGPVKYRHVLEEWIDTRLEKDLVFDTAQHA